MARLTIPALDDVPDASRVTLSRVHNQLGVVPNLYRLLATSPAILRAYVALKAALADSLDARTRGRIGVAVAQVNGCDYCLSVHSYLGINTLKLSPEEIAANRRGDSSDPHAQAVLRFVSAVARERGHVDDQQLASIRAVGYGDAEIVQMVALVIENSFTNYLNEVARTEIDYPVVQASRFVTSTQVNS